MLGLGLGAVAAAKFSPARADGETITHGISSFGDLKYPVHFPNFDYVNVNAPKGGTFSCIPSGGSYNQVPETFNTLNMFILKGQGAQGMHLTFASLMVSAADEPDGMYGAAATSVKISADRLSYQFIVRPEASFHDGSRITAQDVAFSLSVLRDKGHPTIAQQMRDVASITADDDSTVTVVFKPKRARDVPLLVASLPIFSKAYYAGKDFAESSQDIPLGSGPYKVKRFEIGRFIELERVKDWWGAELPVFRGVHNFDVLRYESYRDREVAFQGFTARNYLFREEFTASVWNTGYDFPAVKDGRVKRETVPDETPSGAQGWFINTRRTKFRDPRVREALIQAFDFEWVNDNYMYGTYARTHSPFQNSDLMASGPPSPEELKLLEPFRGQLLDEVFGAPFVPPVSDRSGRDREQRRKAAQLLQSSGYVMKDGKRVMPNGEVFTVEFLGEVPTMERHHMAYIKNLADIGVEASFRLVDSTQYQRRTNDFDFDVTVKRFSMASTPGESMRTFFSSQAASIKGSQNLAGIADPVLDALIDRIIGADSRDEMTVACRAFDRVFRAGRYWVPHWFSSKHRLAYWDEFARPAKLPKYLAVVFPDLWWSTKPASEQAK